MKSNNNRGFTLMEMLVVVAIISILVSIVIVVFSGVENKAKSAACQANRRALYASLTEAELLGGGGAEGQAAAQAEWNENGAQYTCPAGGTISYKIDGNTGIVTVYCSKHAPGNGGLALQNAYQAVGESALQTKNNIDEELSRSDSNGGYSGQQKIAEQIKNQGFEQDIKTWAIVQNDFSGIKYYVWSTYDINEPGTTTYLRVPAIGYIEGGTYDGKYAVGLTAVNDKTKNGAYKGEAGKISVIAPRVEESGNIFAPPYSTDPNILKNDGKLATENTKYCSTLEEAIEEYNKLSVIKRK